jgi:O-antigen/teichoic acid export membrane protein
MRVRHRLRGRPLAQQYAWVTVGNVATAVMSFVAVVVLARVLEAGEFGRLVFAQATMSLVFTILDPRFDEAIVRYVPVIQQRSGERAGSWLYERALALDVVSGYAFTLVGVALLALGAVPLGGTANSTFFLLATIQFGSMTALGSAAAGYQVTGGLARYGVIQSAIALATTCLGLIGLAVAGANGFMAATAAAAGVTTLAACWLATRRVRATFGPPAASTFKDLPGITGFAVKSSLSSSALFGTDRLPLTIIGILGQPDTLASLRVAQSPARLTAMAFSPLPSVLYPVLTRDSVQGREAEIRRRIVRWTISVVPVVAAALVVGWFAVPVLVELLFGSKFEDAGTAAFLLTAAALLRGLVAWSKVLPLAVGRAGIRLIVASLDAVMIGVATWLAASNGGLEAIATAQLAVAAVIVAIYVGVGLALTGGPRRRRRDGGEPIAPADLAPVRPE